MRNFTRDAKGGSRRALLALTAVSVLLLAGCSARVGGDTAATPSADTNDLTADCQQYTPDQGVTDDEIVIGASLPLTGFNAQAGTMGRSIQAYFDTVNENGGVDGRKLTLEVRDDAYDPAKTATNVNELVNQDGVFAFISLLGTANVLAVQPTLQAACVPNLLVATGAPEISAPENTWTTPGLPNYTQDVNALAEVMKNSGVKTVSTFTMNGDFGDAYANGLKAALEGSGIEVIDQATFDVTAPNVDSQITQLAASNADAVLVASVGTKCAQIFNGINQSGWAPDIYTDQLCMTNSLTKLFENNAADGVVTTTWYKSLGDPQFADDEALTEYYDAMKKYAPDANPDEDVTFNGWIWAQLFVQMLEDADNLDRASVMASARNVNLHEPGMLDGINYKLNEERFEPITGLQAQRYNASTKTFTFIDPHTGDDLPAGETSIIESK